MTNSKLLKIEKIRRIAANDFSYFIRAIFAESFDKWIDGEFLDKVASIYQENKKTIRVSARGHFKSTSLYAHFMWKALRAKYADDDLDCHFFSYQSDLAGHHIGGHANSLKRLIERNPFYFDFEDLKTQAETIGLWSWVGSDKIVSIKPQGMLAFKRGIHAPLIYVDDPFQDPENKLLPTTILKINKIFVTQIMSFPTKGGELHVVGTPQTSNDFFFDGNVTRRFSVFIQPAIIDEAKQEVLWPELYDYDELCAKRDEMTPKYFNQEYQCSPVYTEDAFFKDEDIDKVSKDISPEDWKVKYKQTVPPYPMVGGLDIGKKRHPSHIVVYRVRPDKWEMVFQQFWDHMDYNKQVERCEIICDNFGLDWLGYDNTRGEFESLKEQNLLPKAMNEVIFNVKTTAGLATELDKKVAKHAIVLLKDQRLKNSLLSVTNDLKALETPEGHGDAFYSTLAALQWEVEGRGGHFKDIKSSGSSRPITSGLRDREF